MPASLRVEPLGVVSHEMARSPRKKRLRKIDVNSANKRLKLPEFRLVRAEKEELEREARASTASMTHLNKNGNVTTPLRARMCGVLNFGIAYICEVVPVEKEIAQ